MANEINDSKDFSKLYIKDIERDEHVFALQDAIGVQIVRKYNNKLPIYNDKRMFIQLHLDGDKIFGGVDMVKVSTKKEWEIIDTNSIKDFKNKISNFFFRADEGLTFDFVNNKVIFKNREYTINEIISLLEKTHLLDVYRSSRKRNFISEMILKLLFFMVDSKYQSIDYILSMYNKSGSTEKISTFAKLPKQQDPFFKYFLIYKNSFAFFIGLILPPLFKISLILDSEYFSIQNPFLFFCTIGFLLLLEGLGEIIRFQINKENGFVAKLAQESIVQHMTLRF